MFFSIKRLSHFILIIVLISCNDKSTNLKPFDDGLLQFSLISEFKSTTGPVYSLNWFPDGTHLISTGFAQINLWDIDSLKHLQKYTEHSSFVWSVSISPDTNQSYFISASEDSTVKIWNLQSQLPISSINTEWAFCATYSTDGSKYAFGTSDGLIEIRQSSDNTILHSYQLQRQGLFPARAIICIDWSPDNQKIAAGFWYGGTIIFDANTLTVENILETGESVRDDVNGLDWSPDSEILATVHQDGLIRFWNAENGNLIKTISAHSGWVRGIAWTPDGEKIASGGEDKKVYIWDYNSGNEIGTLSNSNQPIWTVKWSPDGNSIAAGSGIYNSRFSNGSVFIWQLEN